MGWFINTSQIEYLVLAGYDLDLGMINRRLNEFLDIPIEEFDES